MKKLTRIASPLPLLLLVFSMVFPATSVIGSPGTTASRSWTPREAVIFALQNSPDSGIAAQRINAASARRDMADAAFRPRLNLSAGYDQTNNPMFSFGNILNQGSFDETIDFNNPGRTDNLNMKAELLYRFYNGGRDEAGLDAAESARLSTEKDRQTTYLQLGFEVVRAFQHIVQAGDQVSARRAEFEAISASLDVAVARYEAGELLKADMLNFQVQRSRASENLIISQHQHELSKKIFLNLLGLEEGDVVINSESESTQTVPSPNNYLQRPEIAALQAERARAEAELQQSAGQRYPTLDGFARYQYDYGFINDDAGDSWAAGLMLNYNLYDGQYSRAETAVKKAALQSVSEQLSKLKLAINLEIQQAELNYNQAVERRAVTEQMVLVARESAQLSRERFKQGLILSSDLIDVELRLTDALVRQSAAKANYEIAIADLRRAAGLQQFSDTSADLLENQL
ncbi:MAG: TolC family protein [Desulfocapsaceae bacterium]|jgi:outer membrane protein TolC|nr:TolC family protein [Desulfocapsaceae bacterium]